MMMQRYSSVKQTCIFMGTYDMIEALFSYSCRAATTCGASGQSFGLEFPLFRSFG